MKYFSFIFLLVVFTSIVIAEEDYQKTDFYSRFATFSYVELDAIGSKSNDAEIKTTISRNLTFVAYNYFMQVQSKVVKPNKSFENALRSVYASHREDGERSIFYLDPLGWALEDENSTLSLPSAYMPSSHEKYLTTVRNFMKFIN